MASRLINTFLFSEYILDGKRSPANFNLPDEKHLLVLNNGTQILLDCGMVDGMDNEMEALNRKFDFDAADVHYVLLSYALLFLRFPHY
jgi:hypothetical protein